MWATWWSNELYGFPLSSKLLSGALSPPLQPQGPNQIFQRLPGPPHGKKSARRTVRFPVWRLWTKSSPTVCPSDADLSTLTGIGCFVGSHPDSVKSVSAIGPGDRPTFACSPTGKLCLLILDSIFKSRQSLDLLLHLLYLALQVIRWAIVLPWGRNISRRWHMAASDRQRWRQISAWHAAHVSRILPWHNQYTPGNS